MSDMTLGVWWWLIDGMGCFAKTQEAHNELQDWIEDPEGSNA